MRSLAAVAGETSFPPAVSINRLRILCFSSPAAFSV